MKRIQTVSVALMFLVLCAGCEVDSPANLLINSPKCKIIEESGLVVQYSGFSTMTYTVINNGGGPTALGISVYVKLKKGNYIVDEGGVGFGVLERGESKSETVWLRKVRSNSEYDHIEVSLSWYDAQGCYYE